MTTDIVERLREMATSRLLPERVCHLTQEAADAIETLRQEIRDVTQAHRRMLERERVSAAAAAPATRTNSAQLPESIGS